MDHGITQTTTYQGLPYLGMCVLLHVVAVKASGFNYDFKDLFRNIDLVQIISGVSGLGSLGLAVLMGKHYYLRNKLLEKELKESKDGEATSVKKEAEMDRV